MAIDPARATLVLNERRYTAVEDATIKAYWLDAAEIVVDTNLDEAGGTALASALFGQTSTYTRVFKVVIEDVLFLEDFTAGPNRYVLDLGTRHPAAGTSTTYTVIAAQIDYLGNRTTLTVRG